MDQAGVDKTGIQGVEGQADVDNVGEIPSENGLLAARLANLFLVLGIVARLMRYLLRFPLWGDECMLAENLLTRDAVGLLAPLDHAQVAPIGFIETVWILIRVFGFNEWSLRFVALAASLTSLLVMRQLAFRILPPIAAMFAVAFLASGYYPIRHAAELKPYSLDLAWGVLLLSVAEKWCRNPTRHLWLFVLAALTPLAFLTSFTATFVAGGICLGLMAHAVARRSFREIAAVLVYGMLLVIAFGGIYTMTATRQYQAHGSSMQDYWIKSFPPSPVNETVHWLKWIIETHTGEMFAYPLGANHGGSTATLLVSVVGAVQFWRRGQRWFLATCLGTFGLGYLAAWAHRYPYGNNERLVQYLGPLICLLAGTGTAALIERLRAIRSRRAIIWATAVGLCLLTVGSSVRDVIRPYKFSFDVVHCGLAKWFWQPDHDSTELYCVRTDLGYNFWPTSWQSHYLCYQRLYSPRHPVGKITRRVADLPPDRPVNIVVYSNEDDPPGGPLWDQWTGEMSQNFRLVECVDHRVLVDRKKQASVWGHYRIYRFAPKSD